MAMTQTSNFCPAVTTTEFQIYQCIDQGDKDQNKHVRVYQPLTLKDLPDSKVC